MLEETNHSIYSSLVEQLTKRSPESSNLFDMSISTKQRRKISPSHDNIELHKTTWIHTYIKNLDNGYNIYNIDNGIEEPFLAEFNQIG